MNSNVASLIGKFERHPSDGASLPYKRASVIVTKVVEPQLFTTAVFRENQEPSTQPASYAPQPAYSGKENNSLFLGCPTLERKKLSGPRNMARTESRDTGPVLSTGESFLLDHIEYDDASSSDGEDSPVVNQFESALPRRWIPSVSLAPSPSAGGTQQTSDAQSNIYDYQTHGPRRPTGLAEDESSTTLSVSASPAPAKAIAPTVTPFSRSQGTGASTAAASGTPAKLVRRPPRSPARPMSMSARGTATLSTYMPTTSSQTAQRSPHEASHEKPSMNLQIQEATPHFSSREGAEMLRAYAPSESYVPSAPQQDDEGISQPQRRGMSHKKAMSLNVSAGSTVPQREFLSEHDVDAEFANFLKNLQVTPDVKSKMETVNVNVKRSFLMGGKLPAMSSEGMSRSRQLSVSTSSDGGNTSLRPPSPLSFFSSKNKSKESLLSSDDNRSATNAGHNLSNRKTRSTSNLFSAFVHKRATSAQTSQEIGQRTRTNSGASSMAMPQHAPPHSFVAKLVRTPMRDLDPKWVALLRSVLRGESPEWVLEFIRCGGFLGLLSQLQELITAEWREEQHDDQMLYEVLRCLKALTMTACGQSALKRFAPLPYMHLMVLLYSDKKPGDVACRKLIIELVESLFESPCTELSRSALDAVSPDAWRAIYVYNSAVQKDYPTILRMDLPFSLPPKMISSGDSKDRKVNLGVSFSRNVAAAADEYEDRSYDYERAGGDPAHNTLYTWHLVYQLMIGPPDPKEDNMHDFLKAAHQKVVFKLWITEMKDIIRDFFWVFCHEENKIYVAKDDVLRSLEQPAVPSGMTGGVEYEAMEYLTSHFRLINLMATTAKSNKDARNFHHSLLHSGLDNVIMFLFKASMVYYPRFHAQLSRYIQNARNVGTNLHPAILNLIDPFESLTHSEQQQVVKYFQARGSAAPSKGY